MIVRALLIIALLLNATQVHASNESTKNILVIHSYSASYPWTDEFQQGINLGISNAQAPIKLSIEYLDTKRVYQTDYLRLFIQYFEAKYKNYRFDAVLITDDNALNLVKDWPNNPFYDLPIIAAGINDPFSDLSSVSKRSHIIYERDNIKQTLDLIETLQPNMRTLYYLADRSSTSELVRNTAFEAFTRNKNVSIVELRDLSLQEATQFLAGIDKNDAIILTHYNTDLAAGYYHSYRDVAYKVARESAAPVFVFWEFYISGGVMGGYVNSSKELGIQMMQSLEQFLPLNFKPYTKLREFSRPVVDFNALERFKIPQTRLMKETVVLNKPKSVFEDNWKLLSVIFVFILSLFTVIVTQAMALKQRRELNKKNKRIVQLQKRTLKTQKDMIVVLGDAIETRSGETGNHVRRVAKLSAHLARLKGLTHREIELLEIISPMHDVGKIAVPESILDKPGKLNAQEWEVMQKHTDFGYKLLNSSKGDVFKIAATIAHEHHERWDGKGYPLGKKGNEIHIFSRITAIVDVFDALLSVRCYKEAWPLDDVIEFLRDQQGKQFDPELTQLFLKHISSFVVIRGVYPDKTHS